jgi:hypothetical protein
VITSIAVALSLVGDMCSEPASGLEWENVGKEEPSEGRQLNEEHEKLRTTLGNKTRFTQKEWEGVGITDLRADHYVRSAAHYFKPQQ